MPLPLAIKAPAALAAYAYVNAKTALWYDMFLLRAVGVGAIRLLYRQRADRLNLFYALESYAQNSRYADKDILIFEGKHYTYARFYDKVLRYGAWLRSHLGVKPKDIVAMDFQNSDTFCFLWFALWSIGAKPAFINYNLTGKSLVHCIKAATASICLVDPAVADNITEEVKSKLRKVRFVNFTPDVQATADNMSPIRFPDSDRTEDKLSNMAILIYTSGTTGLPKAAIVSWAKCIVGGTMGSRLLNRGDDIMYTSMPLYHSSAAILSFCATVVSGSTQALGRKFSTKTFWKDVRDSGATNIQYVGETLRYLLAAPPQIDPITGESLDKAHNVKAAFGNGLRPDIWNKFKARFGVETIAEFYAATEGTLGTWNVSKNDHSAGAIGRNGWLYRALVGQGIAIVQVDWDKDQPWRDPETGFCKRMPDGEPGEMIFKLPAEDLETRFQGYYNNPKATASKILRDVFAKGDAWFRSGDITSWDSDGRVFFSDRIGDTFRWKSENVSTNEVSYAVGLHPAVREANVYGVELPHHDGRAGCVAIAFDRTPDADVLRSLAKHVGNALPKYAVPLFLRVVDQVGGGAQTTGTNKQQKHVLREAGVKPGALKDGSVLYWLKNGAYVPFREKDWRELEGGRVRL